MKMYEKLHPGNEKNWEASLESCPWELGTLIKIKKSKRN